MKCQMDYMESIKKLEEKWMLNHQKHTTNGCIGSSYTKEVSISLNNIYFLNFCFAIGLWLSHCKLLRFSRE